MPSHATRQTNRTSRSKTNPSHSRNGASLSRPADPPVVSPPTTCLPFHQLPAVSSPTTSKSLRRVASESSGISPWPRCTFPPPATGRTPPTRVSVSPINWFDRISPVLVLIICLFVLRCSPLVQAANKQAMSAPRFEKQPKMEIIARLKEQLTLSCSTSGEPKPLYHWLKDGVVWTNSSENGSLQLDTRFRNASGLYQCLATNSFGSAASVKSLVRFAFQDSFPTVKIPELHRPQVGTPFVLNCHPPSGFPIGAIYWGLDKMGSKLIPIDTTDRIALDFDGNLYFAHVLPEDYMETSHYVCIVSNTYFRSIVQGDDRILIPKNLTGPIPKLAAKIAWSSKVEDSAATGETKKLKCIFSGYPTPTITWRRIGNNLSGRASVENFGRELIIQNVEIADEGLYECRASSTAAVTIRLSVLSAPVWSIENPLEDASVAEEDSVQFDCKAQGRPTPTIQWFINGINIAELPADKRRIVGGDFLRLENVTKTDTQIVQCNVSNHLGYLFANAFLNVKAEPPTFINTPPRVLIVAEGRNITLPCQVMAAPKPQIIWRYGGSGNLVVGPRFKQDSTGNLHISSLHLEDDGQYRCIVTNKFGRDEAQGQLTVRKRVVIDESSIKSIANLTDEVSLLCNVTTDPRDSEELNIKWFKDNVLVINDDNYRIHHDGTLHISRAQFSDNAIFKCNASTSYDWAAKYLQVVVRGPPDSPFDVHVTNCAQSYADVSWSYLSNRLSDHDPVEQFVVFYNTSYDNVGLYHQAVVVHKNRLHVRVRLEPFSEYSFHVRSRNAIGLSEMSNLTPGICISPPSIPARNPRHVCSQSRSPNTLTIVWEPMPKNEHYGPAFFYLITYRDLQINVTSQHKESNFEINFLQVPAGTFNKFQVTVQAGNDEGMAEIQPTDIRYVYSGQNAPLDFPLNFEVRDVNATSALFSWSAVDETFARVRGFFKGYRLKVWKIQNESFNFSEDLLIRPWDACPVVMTHPQLKQKRFANKYFQKQDSYSFQTEGMLKNKNGKTWYTEQSKIISSTKIDNDNLNLNPLAAELFEASPNYIDVRLKRQNNQDTVEHRLNGLWPFSSFMAVVSVLNGGHLTGPDSPALMFETPEGVIDAVLELSVIERGSNHLRVAWKRPCQEHGILLGFDIQYRKAPPLIDTPKWIHMEGLHTIKNIRGLVPSTSYLVYVYAVNGLGRGPATFVEDKTLISNSPSRPAISFIETGYDWANVTWTPVTSSDTENNDAINDDTITAISSEAFLNETQEREEVIMYNPGDAFRLAYKKIDSDILDVTEFEHEFGWIILSNLTPGMTYEAQLLAYNDVSSTATKSMTKQFTLIRTGYLLTKLTSAKIWPLLLMLIIILLIAFIIICICICKMNKGDNYNVYKKEYLFGDDSLNISKENTFGEYLTSPKLLVRYSYGSGAKGSVTSVASGSESDSLQEYDDPLLSRFNEDGSFIGIYKPKHSSNNWDVPSTKSSTA